MTEGERERWISQMVHDLRTPLSAIAGYAEMLDEECDAETRRRFAANIRLAAAEMEMRLKGLRAEERESTETGQGGEGAV
ncbi:MAG: histidine kinase dimerization/phospho-acceptor domain-containing protein [Acidobacteriota bacterium]